MESSDVITKQGRFIRHRDELQTYRMRWKQAFVVRMGIVSVQVFDYSCVEYHARMI